MSSLVPAEPVVTHLLPSGVDGGTLLNILPVRVEKCLEMPWLKQLQAEWLALGDYEYTPLDKIRVGDLPSGTPCLTTLWYLKQ